MAYLIDNLVECQSEIYVGTPESFKTYWCIAKPEPVPFIKRLKDAWGVLIGKYQAVYFVEDLPINVLKAAEEN